FSPISCPSCIMLRATARTSGSAQRVSRVEPVSALSGLKLRFPQSFSQISSRMRALTGALSPPARSAADNRSTRSLFSPDGSPRLHKGALHATCIHAFEAPVSRRTCVAVEVPPGNAADRRHHGCAVMEQARHLLRHGRYRVRVQRDDDVVLLTQLAWIVAR